MAKFYILFSFFLSINAIAFSQTPTITSNVGYPVGKSGKQIVYGNSKYVLLSENNVLFESSTGESWTPISTNGITTTQLNNIAFGGSVFVVVGNSGVIQSSTDGITWTNRTSGTAINLIKVYYLNSKFFAIGDDRTLVSSSDGVTWSVITFNQGNAGDDFMSLAYGNSTYVIAARGTGGKIIYVSSTATNNSWTYNTSALSSANNDLNRIEFLNNKFFSFHIGNNMFTSSNGTTWTNITNSIVLTQPDNTTTTWNTSHQAFNGIWDGTNYYMFGSSQYHGGYGSTFKSSNGINWTLLPLTAYIVPQESEYINSKYFVAGNEGIVYSNDGATFNHTGNTYYDMVKTANKYVSVGAMNNVGKAYTSSNFSTWLKTSPNNIKGKYTIANSGSVLLAGGEQELLKSTDDGATWTTIANADYINAMAYGNGKFIFGCYDNTTSAPAIKASSDNGATWTTVSTIDLNALKIKYIGGAFFALGTENTTYFGRVLYSANGTSWVDITPTTNFNVLYYKDVAFNGTKFYLLGVKCDANFNSTGSFIISSATPATASSFNNVVDFVGPNGVVLGGGYNEGTLDYAGGYFVASLIDVSSKADYILYSSNGTTWTAVKQNSYSSIITSAVTGTTFDLLGQNNATFTVSFASNLPVVYQSFTGKNYNNGVALNWSTATEVNAKQFIIEYSIDGLSWRKLDSLVANGNSNSRKDYSYFHKNPVDGVNYYRLVQQDFDLKLNYSKIVKVDCSLGLGIRIFPNPTSDWLNVTKLDAKDGVVNVYSETGYLVKSIQITKLATRISLLDLPKGTYVLAFEVNGRQSVHKLIKH